jgi:hypothetical protein
VPEAHQLVVGGAGKADAGEFADTAVRAVAADDVPGGQGVFAVRAADGQRAVVQCQQLVPAPHFGAESGGAVGQDRLHPRLLQHEPAQRRAVHRREVQGHRTERESRERPGERGFGPERLEQPPVVQLLDDPAAEPVRPRPRVRGGPPVQHHHRGSAEPQLRRQHQAHRARPDHRDIHVVLLLSVQTDIGVRLD